ncbi:MAG: hypothetical protein K8U57_24165 [Planctomycetes bacterium]|nr:hypothetical protein [Planctomycetota bacterium]
MAELTMSGVIRKILSTNLDMSADEVVRRAIARGVKVPAKSIRSNVHNIKSAMKKEASAATATRVAPAAVRETTPPKAAPVAAVAPAPVTLLVAEVPALAGVLANVALVNKIVGLCGGIENARQAAEAVHTCGGTDVFLKHLELVASIRTAKLSK